MRETTYGNACVPFLFLFLASPLTITLDTHAAAPLSGPSYLRRRDLGGVVTISSSTPPPLTSPLLAAWK